MNRHYSAEEFYKSIKGNYPEEQIKVYSNPLSYTDVWSVMECQINTELKKYLNDRYMREASKRLTMEIF